MEPVPPVERPGLTDGDALGALHRWLADGRVDAAAEARARRRWLDQQGAEDATLAGVLLDLAERGAPTTVRTAAGRALAGTIVGLGTDVVVLRRGAGADLVVPLDRVATARTAPGTAPVVGERAATTAAGGLRDLLVELAADRTDVVAVTSAEEVRGRLVTAGRDVVAVALDIPGRDRVHVALAALDHLVVGP